MERIIIEIIKKYIEVDLIYLFGSFLTVNYNEESDIDIAVLAKNRIEKEVFIKIKMEFTKETEREIDLIDLWESNPILDKEILFKGKNIYKKSEEVKLEFEYRKIALATQYSDDVKVVIDKIKERGYIYERGSLSKN
jgi:predicted nucleotidyltransferase